MGQNYGRKKPREVSQLFDWGCLSILEDMYEMLKMWSNRQIGESYSGIQGLPKGVIKNDCFRLAL